MAKPLKPKIDDNYISNEQGKVPKYNPSEAEKKHLDYIYKRRGEMYNFVDKLGLYTEWSECEEFYENNQKSKDKKKVPPINIATEIELIETKGADEEKVSPEAILIGKDDGKVKAEALQELINRIKQINKNKLKKSNFIDNKNIYGVAFQKIYYKEVWKSIKIITEQEKFNKKDEDHMIPKFKWKTHKILAYKDICIDNIPVQHILVNEDATCMDDVYECIQLFYYNDIEKAREEFGNFVNFKYIKKGEIDEGLVKRLNSSIKLDNQKGIDCTGFYYWNTVKDEYSITINGVLLTQYDEDQGGNPVPYKYFKQVPFIRGVCRYMPGKRQFYPKGDVMLINRLKELKNILINAITRSTVINANPVLLATKEVKAQLQRYGTEWQMTGILEVANKDISQAIKTLSVESHGIQEALALIDKIDEYITTITGVDSRALLNTPSETATKTVKKSETSLKRINRCVKLLENEACYREMEIFIALIKQYYEENEGYYPEDELKKDDPKKVTMPKSIPVKNKRFTWILKKDQIPSANIKALIEGGLDTKAVDSLFYTSNGMSYEFLADNKFELKVSKIYQTLAPDIQKALLKLFDDSSYMDLTKEDTEGETTHFEIKKDLFQFDYDIEIRPGAEVPYSELYEQEKLNELAQTLTNNPYIRQDELTKKIVEVNGLDTEKLVKSDQEIQMEMMQQQMMQFEQMKQGSMQNNSRNTGGSNGMPKNPTNKTKS